MRKGKNTVRNNVQFEGIGTWQYTVLKFGSGMRIQISMEDGCGSHCVMIRIWQVNIFSIGNYTIGTYSIQDWCFKK